MGFCQLKLC